MARRSGPRARTAASAQRAQRAHGTWCGGLALLAGRLQGARGAGDEEIAIAASKEGALYSQPPFFDYDCTLPAPDWTEDWNVIRARVVADSAAGHPRLDISEELLEKLVSGALLAGECPLGVLFVTVAAAFSAMALHQPSDMVKMLIDLMELQLIRWPAFVVSASRWPIYEALVSVVQDVPSSDMLSLGRCASGGASGVDWLQLNRDALRWDGFLNGRAKLEEGELEVLEQRLSAVSKRVWGKAQWQQQAQEECPFGCMYLLAARALATSTWDTSLFEGPARALDKGLRELGYYGVMFSGWPIIQKLMVMSSMTMQGHYHDMTDLNSKKKLFRQFSDLQLTSQELCPFGRSATGWARASSLARLPAHAWLEAVPSEVLAREGLRPVFAKAVSAVAAALDAARSRGRRPPERACGGEAARRQECGYSGMTESTCRSWGCCWAPASASRPHEPRCFRAEGQPRRKLVLLTPVWGQRWASLVEPFARWAAKLLLPGVVIVAMGRDVQEACTRASLLWRSVACWSPLEGTPADERGSLLQRHALMHLLVHLGIDVLSFDFDTFLFRNPAQRVEETAEELGAEVLLTGHFDADCLNTGAIYVRASARTAEWYGRYLAWLHAHPYEDEQRGLNALLKYTSQGVSFRPASMPSVQAGALEDADEFASSRGGWLGDWGKLHFFHFVAPVSMEALPRLARAEEEASAGLGPRTWQELKVVDMAALYAAALGPEVDLAVSPLPEYLQAADPRGGSNLSRARATMDLYLVPSAPERTVCW